MKLLFIDESVTIRLDRILITGFRDEIARPFGRETYIYIAVIISTYDFERIRLDRTDQSNSYPYYKPL
ncbi:hypothetical protein EL22_13650 [Halostagnicola sp. A56]|nr:hypothetical protein EL22_13650 [Halostagnicola sp. A56]